MQPHKSPLRYAELWCACSMQSGNANTQSSRPGVLTSNTWSADQHTNSVWGDSCTHGNHLLQQSAREKHRGEAWSSTYMSFQFCLRDDPNEQTPYPADACMQYLCPRQPTQESVKRLYFSFICQIDRIPKEKPMLNTKEVKQFYQPHGNFYKLRSHKLPRT